MPKVELHVHLEGAVRAARLLAIWRRHGLHSHLQQPADIAYLFRHASFGEFLDHFRFVVTSLRDVQDLHDIAADLCADLAAENVVYAEVIFSAAIFARMGIPLGEAMAAVSEAAVDAERTLANQIAVPARYNFVIDLVRNFGADSATRFAAEVARLGHPRIVGIHLGGDERRFPARDFAAAFRVAAEAGLGRAAHAGEADGAASVRDAVESLGVSRIGHGIRSLEDTSVVRMLLDHAVTLEVCPTSNVSTGVVADRLRHPLPALLGAGLRVTLGADDPSFFATTLGGELEHARAEYGLGLDVLEGFGTAGLDAAFLPAGERLARRAAFTTACDGIRSTCGLPGTV
jgi:adenosine deaminase